MKVVLSLAGIAAVWRLVDTTQVVDAWRDVRPAWLIAAIVLLWLQTLVMGERFRLVIGTWRKQISLTRSIRLAFVGAWFNQVLPSTVGGDVVRGVELWRAGLTPRISSLAVLLDRLSGVQGLMLLALVTQPFLFWRYGDAARETALIVGIVAIAGVLALPTLAACGRRVPRRWRPGAVRPIAVSLARLFLARTIALPVLAWSVVTSIVNSLHAYAVAQALGAPLTLQDAMLLVPVTGLTLLLPISLGGWGLREISLVLLWGLAGIPPPVAVAVSVLIGLSQLIAFLPGLPIYWSLKAPAPNRQDGP